jgi:2-oxoisovalerate dehydrogenase E1 component
MASVIPPHSGKAEPAMPTDKQRLAMFGKDKRLLEQPQHMARLINLAMADLMLQYPQVVMCGEDVGKKGGVYGVTAGLQNKFGRARVTDTLLDEQSILGLAIGMAHNGFIPMPEIQFLAYVHNAEDQIRGEAATLPFFSNGEFTNPMVIRIAGLAYQKGFGGHFHNDNSLAVFRDIPGVVIAVPSNGRDASKMLRTCVKLAHQKQRVVVFVEPIALYMTRDLHQEGDNLWTSIYEPPGVNEIEFGEIGVFCRNENGDGDDLCIVTYGNGYYLSRQAEKILQEQHGIRCKVVDIRWLAPLNEQAILDAAADAKHVLIVDECRRTGSQSEALTTLFYEQDKKVACGEKPLARVTADDSFIPLAEAANLVLPSVEGIVKDAIKLINK